MEQEFDMEQNLRRFASQMRLLSSSYLPDRLPTDPPRSQSLVPIGIRALQVYAKISLGSCLAICTYVFQIKMFLLFRGLY